MDVAVPLVAQDFLDRGGESGSLISQFDWSGTSLGPISGWPELIKTTVALIIRSPVAMATLWGEDGVMIYNDAYAQIAGGRHPFVLGSKVREAWPEVADFNDGVMRRVFGEGRALSLEDQELVLVRHGSPETCYFNLDYSPILDERGTPVGVIAIVVETTAKVRAERLLRGERERLRLMFDQAPGFMALLEGPEHVYAMTNDAYDALIGRRPSAGQRVADVLPEVADQGFIELLNQVYTTGEPYVGRGVPVKLEQPGSGTAERFVDFVYQPIVSDGEITGIFVQGHEVTEQKRFERHLQLLIGELNHRVKNSLAVIQSFARQSFHSSVPAEEGVGRFEGRLQALAAAHNLLTRNNWDNSSIEDVVLTALNPFCTAERCTTSGPPVPVSPQTAVGLALALHELATNAAKYGALSNDAGKVRVDWSTSGDEFELTWSEVGGPTVRMPDRRGFGTRMIERTLAAEFGGTVQLDFDPAGVRCRLVAPIPAQ